MGGSLTCCSTKAEGFEVGSFKLGAMHTPRHTPAHMSWRIHDALFVGDIAFHAGLAARRDNKAEYTTLEKSATPSSALPTLILPRSRSTSAPASFPSPRRTASPI